MNDTTSQPAIQVLDADAKRNLLRNIAFTRRTILKEQKTSSVPLPDVGYAWFIAFLSFLVRLFDTFLL
jgi:hypothetical protein